MTTRNLHLAALSLVLLAGASTPSLAEPSKAALKDEFIRAADSAGHLDTGTGATGLRDDLRPLADADLRDKPRLGKNRSAANQPYAIPHRENSPAQDACVFLLSDPDRHTELASHRECLAGPGLDAAAISTSNE